MIITLIIIIKVAPDTNQGKEMEFFDRVKAILVNPKEEWIIIEAENTPHSKVFAGYLLILALIPAITIFISYVWKWFSAVSGFVGFFDSPYLKYVIIGAFQPTVIILGGVYLSAFAINAFSEQFGSAKDLSRTFSLVAYSYTPLCVAGLLNIFNPLAFLVPFVGLYGFFLLYIGVESLLKPAADKKIVCIIISLIAVIAVWVILSNVVPAIFKSILTEMAKSNAGNMLKDFEKMIPR